MKPETVINTRKSSGLTQGQAADMVHISIQAWQNYEYGKTPIPKATWQLFKVKIALLNDKS